MTDITYIQNFYETDSQNNLEDDINTYVENIKINPNYAGDIEINIITEIMHINIICYFIENSQYSLKAVYFGNENKKVLLRLNYVNQNHFKIFILWIL